MGLLSVAGVTVERERLPIVRDVSLEVHAGEITVLLGVNGSGKTTLLEGLSGTIGIAAGEVRLDGARIDRREPFRRVAMGLVHVEQGRTVFPELTTQENLLVASGGRDTDEVYDVFPELGARRKVAAGLLSGGEQQMVVLGRAFLLRPKALLLDELSLGLAPRVVGRLLGAVRELSRTGIAVLLVEQFAKLALRIGARAYVLRGGEIVYDGTCDALRADDRLLASLYLGDAADQPEEVAR